MKKPSSSSSGEGLAEGDAPSEAMCEGEADERDGDGAGVAAAVAAADMNHDLCHICGFGGTLLCCDTCPRAFHSTCLSVAQKKALKHALQWSCPACLDGTNDSAFRIDLDLQSPETMRQVFELSSGSSPCSLGRLLQALEVYCSNDVLRQLAPLTAAYFSIPRRVIFDPKDARRGSIAAFLARIQMIAGRDTLEYVQQKLSSDSMLAIGLAPSLALKIQKCDKCKRLRHLRTFCYFCGMQFAPPTVAPYIDAISTSKTRPFRAYSRILGLLNEGENDSSKSLNIQWGPALEKMRHETITNGIWAFFVCTKTKEFLEYGGDMLFLFRNIAAVATGPVRVLAAQCFHDLAQRWKDRNAHIDPTCLEENELSYIQNTMEGLHAITQMERKGNPVNLLVTTYPSSLVGKPLIPEPFLKVVSNRSTTKVTVEMDDDSYEEGKDNDIHERRRSNRIESSKRSMLNSRNLHIYGQQSSTLDESSCSSHGCSAFPVTTVPEEPCKQLRVKNLDDPLCVETSTILLHPLVTDLLCLSTQEEAFIDLDKTKTSQLEGSGLAPALPNHQRVRGARRLQSRCPWRRKGAEKGNSQLQNRCSRYSTESALQINDSCVDTGVSLRYSDPSDFSQTNSTILAAHKRALDGSSSSTDDAPVGAGDVTCGDGEGSETTSYESSASPHGELQMKVMFSNRNTQSLSPNRKRRRKCAVQAESLENQPEESNEYSTTRKDPDGGCGFNIDRIKQQVQQYLLRFDVTDLMGFDPSTGEVPMTPVHHCSHCGFENARSKTTKRCASCNGCLSSKVDYGSLTDALVWTYVFEDVGVPIVCHHRTHASLADVIKLLPVVRCYQTLQELGHDFFKLQSYFVTHLIYVMSDWGQHALQPGLFHEELFFFVSNMRTVINLEDPELVGEFIQCLKILQVTPRSQPEIWRVVEYGLVYLIDLEHERGSKGQWTTTAKLYDRYHTSYCAAIGLMDYGYLSDDADPNVSPPLPNALKFL